MNKYIYILFAFLLISCSDHLADVDDADAPLLTRGYSNEQIKLQRLGYAYNAAGNVMDDGSFSASPIINMDRLKAAETTYGIIISSERRHYTSMDIFSGTTLQEMGHEETKYTINDDDLIGSGKYYRNNSTIYKGQWKNTYKAHMFIKHVMASMTIDVGILRCLHLDDLNSAENVLDQDFRQKLSALVNKGESRITIQDATEFSEQYGTHLVVSSNLGGMIELQMEINRDSCVDKVYATQQVGEVILGKNVVTTTNSKVLSELSQHTIQYHGKINVKGGSKKDCDALSKTFDDTKTAEVKISDGDYYAWADHISIEPASYNASFVAGYFLPLYDLFEDVTKRQVLRKVYEMYLKKEAPIQEVDESPYGFFPLKDNYGSDVRVASVGNNKACVICEEYVPSIRSDKPCVVAYPLIKDQNNDMRPFLYSGLFIGDESHRPGRVIWEGSASVYIPSDSIFFENDAPSIHKLFDEETHALKHVYLYWNAVHPQPCPTEQNAALGYTTSVFSLQPNALAAPTTFAKVASTFWSIRPVELKPESILNYWGKDQMFDEYSKNIYKDHNGIFYKLRADGREYNFCLVDGGENIQRVPERTGDNDGLLRWTDAVSQSVQKIGLNDYLPTVAQSKSITQMMGNRMSIFYSHANDGRNMLGLDWPTGYRTISSKNAANAAQNDSHGIPIITNDAGQVRIMRLSGSGTDLLLEYPEYVKAFNYSDQSFFKYFPIYITIDKF